MVVGVSPPTMVWRCLSLMSTFAGPQTRKSRYQPRLRAQGTHEHTLIKKQSCLSFYLFYLRALSKLSSVITLITARDRISLTFVYFYIKFLFGL